MRVTNPNSKKERETSKEEKSPYLCFAAIPPIIFSTLGKVCKNPLDAVHASVRLFLGLSRALRRAERSFSFPPLSFKTDVIGPGRVAPPASPP